MKTETRRRIVAVAAVLLLLLAACGKDSKASGSASSSESPPQRIVSLSPTATEMLFAIGADKQVVAVDDQSNFPANAPKSNLSGFQPNAEAIAGYHPDLVVIADDSSQISNQLTQLHIPVLVEPSATTIDDSYNQIIELGAKTGHHDAAAQVVSDMRRQIDELTKDLPRRAKPLTYYHELDNTLYTVTSKTFIGQVYSLAGLQNVADPADANGQSGGFPQLSAEFLVQADPDLVFLADTKCCSQNESTFAARPGFASMKAVQQHHVVQLDDDIASRWGPRIVDFLRTVIDAEKAIPSQ